MTIQTSPKEVYVVSPASRFEVQKNICNFMDGDFTISLKLRFFQDLFIPNVDGYAFSRNGIHSGISFIKCEDGRPYVKFNYWFMKKNSVDPPEYREVAYRLPIDTLDNVNSYILTCDSKNEVMKAYFNDVEIGQFNYSGYIKIPYEQSYIWLGCGNMLGDPSHCDIGEFEYHQLICMDKFLTIEEILDIQNNHQIRYTTLSENFELPILRDETPHRENIVLFLDFETKTQYKIWNLCFNGVYPQLYFVGNTDY